MTSNRVWDLQRNIIIQECVTARHINKGLPSEKHFVNILKSLLNDVEYNDLRQREGWSD